MVSIITVNYNNTSVTLELLSSIERLSIADIEVIVVDNGSKENPATVLSSQYPWVRFIRSDKNLGFAGGNNLGITHATGDYLFFINNDTEFKTDIIPQMVSVFKKNPHIGVLCPVIYYFEEPRQVQYSGYTDVNRLTGRNEVLTQPATAKEGWPILTSYAHGAAMMIPRKVIEKAGMMPENYFLYYEEFDWCEKIKESGYYIAVETGSAFYHKESRTVGAIGELKSYFMSRNRILFMRRNSTPKEAFFFLLYFTFVVTPKEIFRFSIRMQWKNIVAHVAGILWNLRHDINAEAIGYKFDYLKY